MPAIHPLSRPALFYVALITLVDATYTAFVVPIGIAFQYQVDNFSWFNALDIAGGAIQLSCTPSIASDLNFVHALTSAHSCSRFAHMLAVWGGWPDNAFAGACSRGWKVHIPRPEKQMRMPCAGVIYWVDIVMGFMTGFVVIYNLRRRVIRDPRLVAEYYIWCARMPPPEPDPSQAPLPSPAASVWSAQPLC